MKVRHLAIGAFRIDEVLFAFVEHRRRNAVVLKRRVLEIADYRLTVRQVHGQIVMRVLPLFMFRLVTLSTSFSADEVCSFSLGHRDQPIGQHGACTQNEERSENDSGVFQHAGSVRTFALRRVCGQSRDVAGLLS